LKKKKILFILLGLFLIYAVWLGFQLLQFRTYTLPDLKSSSLEIQGAYHIHTIHSDGRKSTDKIAELASGSSLDFIILTDHGNPNRESIATAGWKNDVLVLAGSELSVSRGHLVALGFTPAQTPFSQNAETAFNQVKAQGGISIIAHPYSKVSWSWGKPVGYDGLEIINANTMLKYDRFRLILLIPSLLVKPEWAMLKMLRFPEKNLKKWDELNLRQPTFGFYSVDAHLLYNSLLPLLQLHVFLDAPLSDKYEQASRQVLSALNRGHFYNAVDAAAQANGFRFWAQKGQKRVGMGEKAFFDSRIILHIQTEFPFAREVHLIHNGKIIMTSSKKNIEYRPTEPGFYRVEVYLKEKTPMRQEIPWILSNPIFFKEKRQ
jgi:hypothetical protein